MIKKICLGLVACILVSGSCFALSSNQQAIFSVSVSSIFELSIDQGVVDFGKMKPGETKWNVPSAGVTVTSKTNNGRAWYLKVSDVSPFTFGELLIPNSNFVWSGWTDGSGKWNGTGNNIMSVTPVLAYSSGVGEENNLPAGVANHFKFKLSVPDKQAPGIYMTTVKFTMTE